MRNALFLVTALFTLSAFSVRAEIFYQVDFESGDTESTVNYSGHEIISGAITSVANPDPDNANTSSRVGRFWVPSSAEKVRAELTSQPRLPTDGHTYRYRWSYYIPTGFFDQADFEWLVTSQWKTHPCEVCNPIYDPAICHGCGGIFNEVRVIDEQSWDFRWRAEPDCHDHPETIVTGRWVRFEMLVYWTTGTAGYFRLWRDGTLVKAADDVRTLFTSFEEGTCDMRWSLGLYAKWTGSADELVIYIDDIEISDDTAPPADGGPIDGGAEDGRVEDGGTDDGGAADGGDDILTAGEPDGDAGGDGDANNYAASCVAIYGGVNGFNLCRATQTRCSFNAIKDGIHSCDDVCSAHGGQCLAAHGNSSEAPCVHLEDLPCDLSDHIDDICVCGYPGGSDGDTDPSAIDGVGDGNAATGDPHASGGETDVTSDGLGDTHVAAGDQHVSDGKTDAALTADAEDGPGLRAGCACGSASSHPVFWLLGALFCCAAMRRRQ